MIELGPLSRAENAEDRLKRLLSALKQWRYATESRLRFLAGSSRQPEISDLMLAPDKALCGAQDEIEAELEGRG